MVRGTGNPLVINPYEILGVQRDASPADLKRAFRQLALEWHPDRNRSPDASPRFQLIATAYAILGDLRRRAAWHSAESDAWFRYIEDGTPLPWQTATTSPFDSCEPLPWDNNDPLPWDKETLPWDDGSGLPF